MKRRGLAAIVAAGVMLGGAQQTGFDGVTFVQALRDRDDTKASELFEERGTTLVNLKDVNGDTPLIAAVSRKSNHWTATLLNSGADPNLANRDGDTPLIAATRIGYEQGIEWLLFKKAKVNQANRRGETPLIIAVQQRRIPLVRLLLEKGANPDRQDTVAGYSARDYAKRDTRTPELLRLIEASTAKPAADDD